MCRTLAADLINPPIVNLAGFQDSIHGKDGIGDRTEELRRIMRRGGYCARVGAEIDVMASQPVPRQPRECVSTSLNPRQNIEA